MYNNDAGRRYGILQAVPCPSHPSLLNQKLKKATGYNTNVLHTDHNELNTIQRASPLWGQTVKIRISNYVLKWPFAPTKAWIYPQLTWN